MTEENKPANPWISLQKAIIAFVILGVSTILSNAAQMPGAELTLGAILIGAANFLKHVAKEKGEWPFGK